MNLLRLRRALLLPPPSSPSFSALLQGTRRQCSSAAATATTASTATEGESPRERRRRERAARPQPQAIEGTAPNYKRQLVVVDDTAADVAAHWPQKLELSEHVLSVYAQTLMELVENPKSAPLTAIAATPFPYAGVCHAQSTAPTNAATKATQQQRLLTGAHDLLVFPDLIRIKSLDLAQVPTLVQKLLDPTVVIEEVVKSLELEHSPLEDGFHILVCAHEKRDVRCGCNGPKLLRWLEQSAADKKIPLRLYSSSHFGGHRYAANCITYPSGDWFGLLNTEMDADNLLEALAADEPLRLKDQWRGRMDLTKEAQIEALRVAWPPALEE